MKKNIGKIPYLYPVPIVLVSSMVDGKPNFTTVGDAAIMGLNPALMVISLNEKHHTTKGVVNTLQFAVNIPNTDLMSKTDFCGIYSGRDVDKSNLFTLEENQFNVPMIKECPACIVCKVVKDFNIEQRHFFVGEVLSTFIEDEYLSEDDGKIRIAPLDQLDPIIYGLDNKYYSMGKEIGIGYREGKD